MIILATLLALSNAHAQKMTPCGLHGTIQERITDCATPKTVKKYSWDLVMRDVNDGEHWLDRSTGLIWSDILDQKYTHFEAMPINKDGVPKQFACGTSLQRIEGAQPWRLGELSEFFGAYEHKSYAVIPGVADWIWTGTLDDAALLDAHAVYSNGAPDYGVYSRDKKFSVRCVTKAE